MKRNSIFLSQINLPANLQAVTAKQICVVIFYIEIRVQGLRVHSSCKYLVKTQQFCETILTPPPPPPDRDFDHKRVENLTILSISAACVTLDYSTVLSLLHPLTLAIPLVPYTLTFPSSLNLIICPHLSSLNLRPSTFIPPPSFLTLHPSPFIPHP